jgi:hypothetical protein
VDSHSRTFFQGSFWNETVSRFTSAFRGAGFSWTSWHAAVLATSRAVNETPASKNAHLMASPHSRRERITARALSMGNNENRMKRGEIHVVLIVPASLALCLESGEIHCSSTSMG